MRKFDLIVIGSGPAGQRAALQGAKAGKKVALIESGDAVGGGCVHSGTLPSKSFRESVYRYSLSSRGYLGQEMDHHGYHHDPHDSELEGLKKTPKIQLPEMKRLVQRKDRVVSGEAQVIFDQLSRNGIHVIHGHARFKDIHHIEVSSNRGREVIMGEYIFIAVGAAPVSPKHIEIDGKIVHDSNTILGIKKVPRNLVVLGAGIIGCEYASMFSMAGTKVFLVDKRHEVLATVDREIVSHMVELFTHYGMEVVLGAEAKRVGVIRKKSSKTISGANVYLTNGRSIRVDAVLVAQGRAGNTKNLDLAQVGIQTDDRGTIKVDDHFRTTVPNIYAVGDVIGAPALASTSMEQGRIACVHAFQIKDRTGHISDKMPALYPYGIYTIPEISTLGKTEEQLVADKVDFVVGRARYRELARGQIVGDKWGLLKLCVERKTYKVLGVHIIGDNAADLIHIGQAVMTLGGDAHYFIQSVFNYPTLAEAYKTAAFHAVNQILGTTRTR